MGPLRFETSFYWPPYPGGVIAGYTAPAIRFVESRILGVLPNNAPIVVKGYYAQSYRPGHHNFSEDFVFDPHLSDSVPAQVKAWLKGLGVRRVYVSSVTDPPFVLYEDFSGRLHEVR